MDNFLDQIICGDNIDVLSKLPDNSVDLVVTSPPYADLRSGQYNSYKVFEYNDWFINLATEIKKILKPTESIVKLLENE